MNHVGNIKMNLFKMMFGDAKPERYDPNDWKDTPENELELHPPAYPFCGLYHSLSHSEALFPDIIHKPIDEQMEYADAIARRYVLNPHFLKMQKEGLDKEGTLELCLERVNTTAVGNMAILAHYNPLGFFSDYYDKYIKALEAQYPKSS